MAATNKSKRVLRPRHQDEIKAKIQTSQLLNRLQNHIDGTVELSGTQIDAIKFLMNKTLSNAPTITDNKTDVTLGGNININVQFD